MIRTNRGNSPIDTVVVGVDGSDTATAALDWATEEAVRRHAHLRIIHSWTMPAVGPYSLYLPTGPLPFEDFKELAQKLLDEQVGRARDRAGSRLAPAAIEARLVFGPPGRALIEEAALAALVVVGSRGHGAVAGALLSSVGYQLIHHAPCAVAVVPPPVPAEGGLASPASCPPRRITVGVDGSTASIAALQWAVGEAVAQYPLRPTSVDAVFVAEEGWRAMWPEHSPDSESAAQRVAEDAVAAANAQSQLPADILITAHHAWGDAGRVLPALAQDAQMLVVGSRGRGGFVGLLLGSVSHKCSHHLSTPLVIVRASAVTP